MKIPDRMDAPSSFGDMRVLKIQSISVVVLPNRNVGSKTLLSRFRHFLGPLCMVLVSFMAQSGYAGGPILILPTSVVEGAGILTNGGQVNLCATAASNIVVTLQSSDLASVALPASVTILSGQSNAFFNVTIGDNLIADGNRNVTITATTVFSTNATAVLVVDNDPDHIRFAAVPSIMDTNNGFFVLVTAVNADGSVQTNFNGSLAMIAQGLEGALLLATTNSGNFSQGQRYVNIQVTAPGHGIRIGCLEYPGQSDAFTVIPPAFYPSSQPVADIVWHQASQTLLASVPANGGVYSNCLVAIDPATGMVTNSYPVGFDPSQIEISPSGNYLYVALNNHTMLQRFDLNTRVAGVPFALGTNSNSFRYAYDFCVPPEMTDSVVVAVRVQDYLGNTSIDGIYRYDSGSEVALPNFSAVGWLVESMDTGFGVAVSPPLATGNASTGAMLATSPNFSGKAVTYRGGEFFDGRGNVYSSGNLAQLGTYPSVLDQIYYTALPEVDSVFRRVFYLAGYFNYGSAIYQLKVYDRDLFQPLFQWTMPSAPGSPTRLLRCDTNSLVYVAGNQLWFIRPDATQPPRPLADLSLSVSAPLPAPAAGVSSTFSLTLSNAGPGVASVVRVTNTLPANAVIVQTVPSTGAVTPANSAFTWNVSNLGAGSNATLHVTIQFNSGGWQTNTAWALGYERDPVFTNNIATMSVYVQLPQQEFGVFPVNFAAQDLLYDPARDRLILTVTNIAVLGQTNGLAVFNPYTGLAESFIPMNYAPSKMARSDDGQFLYVSLPDVGRVQQFSLPTLATNYNFVIGGEVIYGVQYTNYARSLAVVPGQPDSIVAWAVRHPYAGSLEYGYGIGLYRNGVMASSVTDNGGSWQVLFDTDSGTLFGYNNGDLRQCSLDSNGVAFVEQYPTLSSAGSDIEYGGGHLFNTGGEMLDYNPFRVDWVFAGAQGAALVAPDKDSGRVFFLVQNGGWQLKAYDISSRRLLGSQAISNVVGTPSKLIRWGYDGLAFQTSGNQLFIIRSPMVRTNTFADLAISLAPPTGTVPLGSNAAFTVTLANQGTLQATNVVITNILSAGATLVSVSADAGTWTSNASGQTAVWSLPALDAGAHVTLSYTCLSAQTGLLTALSTATTTTFDPAASNNTSVATVLVGAPIGLDGSYSFQIAANDMVWSPTLGKFLVTANSSMAGWAGGLLSVDPASFTVQFQAALGADAGRLAISRDDAVLYAGADSGATEVTIPSLIVTNHLVINPTWPVAYAYDLKVIPGNNQAVAIGGKTTGNNSTWVATFDDGVQLSSVDSFYCTVLSLEFGDQSSPLFAYNGTSFNRYSLDTNGVAVLDATSGLLPASTPMDLVWGNGLIYSSVGSVINPSNLTLRGTIAGIPSGSRVVYDPTSGWVFYLSPGSNQATLSAFDGATLLPAGSRTIPGVSGSLMRFIRWGADGFAALTGNNQLVVFRSSLIPTNPPADVSVSLAHSPPPYVQGSNITAIILVSNAGPNTATSVAWSHTLPVGAIIANANSSAGSLMTNSNSVAGSISSLATGATATITVTFAAPAAGLASDQIIATASSTDPSFANNSAAALLWIQPTNGLSNLVSLTLPVKDLEHDPTRTVLYASLGSSAGALANAVVTIDPVNGIIGPLVPVGSNPGRLAVSADGQFLFVALDGAGMVQKLSLPSLAAVSSFAVPQNQTVIRMAVCPTNSDMVAIRRSPAGKTSLHVAGVERPNELSSQDLFAFVDTTGQLFGCDGFHSNVKLYQLDTGTNGLGLVAAQPGKQSNANDLRSSGDLLFFNGGMVMNSVTTRGVDMMPVPYNSVVTADAGCGRAFYLAPAGSAWIVRAFDIRQGIEVGAVPLPTLSSPPQKLLRWGTDGLATYNTNSQIVILRGQLVPTNPPVDVTLAQSISPLTATTNDTVTFSLQLTNMGPVTALGVVVTQSFSSALTNVNLQASLGVALYTNRVASWQIGNLPTGMVAALTLRARTAQTGTLTVTAFANHNLNDVFWGNNAAIGAVNVSATNSSNTLILQLSARQLMYDATRDVIYASTPASNRLTGNLIAEIDPATGAMKGALAAGSEPDQISLSDDGAYLHVALDGAMGVQRFNLVSSIADLSFGFSTNDIFYAQDLVIQPGQHDTVAASLSSYNLAATYPSTVVAYDDGIPRPNTGGPSRGLTFSSDGSTLFGGVSPGSGSAVKRMALGPQGFSTVTMGGFTSVPGILKFSNGRLYSAAGQVLDANAGTLIGTMAASGPQAIDSAAGRAFYLTQSAGNWQIRAFDLATLQSSGTQAVASITGTPSSLIRCGQDRLAFLTSAGQIFIVHTPLAIANATNPPSPVLNLLCSTISTSNAPVLQMAVQTGYWYTVYTSTNLVDWAVLTNFYSTIPITQITDATANGSSVRFYRVVSP